MISLFLISLQFLANRVLHVVVDDEVKHHASKITYRQKYYFVVGYGSY